MSRLAKIVAGVANIATKGDLGAYDRILLDRLRGYDGDGQQIVDSAYEKVDLVFSCISYTSKAIAQIPLLVVKKGKSGKFDPVSEDDVWQTLLDHPNYMTSKVQFVTSIISYLLLDGCVAIIPFPPSFNAVPDSLWVIPWKYCKYELDKNGHLKKWIYRPKEFEGPSYDLAPNELFQVKFWNPNNPIEGLAPIKAGRLPVLELYKSSDYNQRFFDQGAMPGGVLSTSQRLKQADVDMVLTQFKEKHQGYTKRWEPAVLHQDLKWQPTGITQKDMDFVNLRTKSSESIMQIFGMKKVIMGITESLNYATGREQRKEWWTGTCLPLMRLVSDTLTYGLFQRSSANIGGKLKNYRIQFDISAIEALHEDYNSKVKTAEAMFRMGVPFDEINAILELGLDPKPWYTLAFVPVTMMCVNYKDVGIENPVRPGDSAGNGSSSEEPEVEEELSPPPKADRKEPEGIDLLTEHYLMTQESNIARFLDENIHPFIKSQSKTVTQRLRRGIFDMRARTLQCVLGNNNSFSEARRLIETTCFDAELEGMKKGIIGPWEELVGYVDWIINNDEKKLLGPKEKVDNPDSRAIRMTWLSDFFVEIQKLVERKKRTVLKILEDSESIDSAVSEIRGMFNRSLNEVNPLVKAEVRRIVMLFLASAK